MKIVRFGGVLLICLSFFLMTACQRTSGQLDLKSVYHVVFIDNNNAYIGKVTAVGSDYLYLSNVYYIQSEMNQETKQMSNTLVKRGQEWHKPDSMYVNVRHVVMIEPVTPGSQVAKLIEQSEATKK